MAGPLLQAGKVQCIALDGVGGKRFLDSKVVEEGSYQWRSAYQNVSGIILPIGVYRGEGAILLAADGVIT